MSDVVDRFSGMPWGWKPEWEIVLLIARLFMAGEIKLMCEGVDLDPKGAFDPLSKAVRHRQVSILKKKVPDAESVRQAGKLYKDLFAKLAREDADGLVADFRTALGGWQGDLRGYLPTASLDHHPGKTVIETLLARIVKQLAIRDGFEFITAMLEAKKDWLDASEDAHDVTSFYKTQLPTWKRLLVALAAFADNREILIKNPDSAKALTELAAIRDNPAPYGQIPQIDGLIQIVQGINDVAVVQHREQAIKRVDALIAEVIKTLDKVQAGSDLRNQALLPLQELKVQIGGLASIPRIRYQEEQAGNLLDEAMLAIERATAPPPSPPTATPPGTPPAVTVTAAASLQGDPCRRPCVVDLS